MYETFTKVSQLADPIPTSKDAFDCSVLRKKRLSDDEFADLLRYCEQNGIQTLGQLLKDYNGEF